MLINTMLTECYEAETGLKGIVRISDIFQSMGNRGRAETEDYIP